MNWPCAVGIMPTRNRPQMAHRAIHLFLEQDYEGPRRLVVFDDGDVGLDICFQCEGRFELKVVPKCSLPKKRNDMMEYVADQGAIYFLWDDDDYHGPDRASTAGSDGDEPPGLHHATDALLQLGHQRPARVELDVGRDGRVHAGTSGESAADSTSASIRAAVCCSSARATVEQIPGEL